MREIDLIVIGDVACGTTKAYLTYLKDAGLKPKSLWLTRFLPASDAVLKARRYPFGVELGNFIHRRQSCAPPSHSAEFKSICDSLQRAVRLPISFCDEFDYGGYAEDIHYLTVSDYNDPFLHKKILKNRQSTFLYTNGGIVPESLLLEPDVKIFHIHPGVVPHMRGSDCFLWSNLVRGRAGASCFYMSPGIDEGEILAVEEFSRPDLGFLKESLNLESEETIYRALSFSLDPHMRAMVFIKMLIEKGAGSNVKSLPSEQQDIAGHTPYLWMHPKLRYKVIKDLLTTQSGDEGALLEVIKP